MREASFLRYPAASLAVAMAITGTVGAFAIEAGLDPITTVFWRCVFGSVFLGLWCLICGYLPDRTLSPARLALSVLGGICIVLNWAAFFAAFAMTSIATTTIVYHVQPFFVVLIGVVFLGERIRIDQLVWMLLAFAGVVLASGAVFSSGHMSKTWMLGIGLTLAGAMLYAISTILAKGLGGQRPEVTALTQTLTGIVMLAPFVHFGQTISGPAWGWLIGIGVLHTGISYVLMYSAYPRLKTPIIGILTFIYPLVAIIVDWAIYHHPLGLDQAAGLALIALATLAVRLGWRFPVSRISARNGFGFKRRAQVSVMPACEPASNCGSVG